MHSIDQIIEAIIARTDLILATENAPRAQLVEHRMQALAGMCELAHWLEQRRLERKLEAHSSALRRDQIAQYQPFTTVTITLPSEFKTLCERDQVKPEMVLRGFIADLCGIMNWASHPRADGYSSNGSDERRLADEYYNRVGYPYFHRKT